MDYLPIFADVRDRPCLIVGAGQVATRKMQALRRAGARVTLVAPAATQTVMQAAQDGAVNWLKASFQPQHIAASVLVISATNDPLLNQRVARAARAAGRLCNVVDAPALCTFITPAIVERGAVTIAISSGGRSPTIVRWLKALIERTLPVRLDALVALATRWRATVGRTLPSGLLRQRFWLDVLDGNIADHALAGRNELADRAMTRRLARRDESADAGVAWLVGAGPGDSDLITLRGARLLARADVVLHDALVCRSILNLARRDATVIDVGKRAGRHAMPQQQINEMLIDLVARGRRVCRLKGGDPLVFGRGGEEALALSRAGLAFEIVPGVTAASACGAYAGIPLTHRGVADAVTFATAHHCTPQRSPDYAALADAGKTAVFYMGARQLQRIAAGLIGHGRDPGTPVMIVHNGGRHDQSAQRTTLADLGRHRIAPTAGPACVIVGEVVALAQELAWFAPNTQSAAPAQPHDTPPPIADRGIFSGVALTGQVE